MIYKFYLGDFMKSTLVLIISGLFGTLLLISSCTKVDNSPIKSEIFNTTNIPDIIDKMKIDKALKNEDIEMFSASLARNSMTLDSLNGKTIGQIIDAQRDFLRESSVSGLVTTAVQVSHGFKYLGWQSKDEGDKKFNVFGFAIQNKSKQDIKHVVGLLKFVDETNQMIRGFRINVTQEIKANTLSQFNSTFPFDEKNQNDIKLRDMLDKKVPNLYAGWQPTLIEYSNGKKLSLDTIPIK